MLDLVAALAPGKRVTVISGGKAYELPVKPPVLVAEPPHPLEAIAKQLSERDAEIRDLLAAVTSRTEEAITEVKAAVKDVAAGHDKVAQSVDEMTKTLHLPVKPHYDKAGKLEYAKRVKK